MQKCCAARYPHARLLRVDASRAAKLPGVVAVLTRDDLKGMNSHFGPVVKDQPVVAIDRVRYVGDIIAAVAAEEKDIAEEALELIEVEYEPLPAVFDLHDCDEARCAGHSRRSSQSAVVSGKERISP